MALLAAGAVGCASVAIAIPDAATAVKAACGVEAAHRDPAAGGPALRLRLRHP